MTFADWINEQMRLKRVSGRTLARETGASIATVSSWRCGRSRPMPATGKRLAVFFGAEVDEVLRLAGWIDE